MKEKIKFSVLMSVYKKEKANNLKTAIDSIVNQTLIPNEFIIIEDGPLTSELENVLNEYTRKYNWIKTIKLEKNVGLGVALKEGVLHCNYEYIARMDSDDYSLANRFEEQINKIKKDKMIDVIGTCVIEYDETMQKRLKIKRVPEDNDEISKYIKKRNPINHMSVMYKKQKVLEAGNYIKCEFFEDYYLWCRMIKNGCRFYNIQKNLVNVRAGNEMINRRGGICYCKHIINFQNKILRIKMINLLEYLINILIRCFIAIMPSWIRERIYNKLLRG